MSDNVRRLLSIVRRKYLLIIGGILVYCTLFLVFYNLLKYGTVVPYDNEEFLISWLLNFIPIVLVICFNVTAVFFVSPRTLAGRRMSLKICLDILLSGLSFFLINWLFRWTFRISVDWVGTSLNSILVLLIVEVIYYVIASKNSMQKAQEEEKRALQYRYEVLKAQVNPHFLFNSLNILYSLISIDRDKSREFTLQLSSMYRYLLLWQNKDVAPLEEEIEFLKSYVQVLEMRHRGQMKVDISGEENAAGRMIVPHTLQLLVENVTKHNVISARNPMNVSVTFSPESITVSNPVRLKETDNSTGLGIRYILELYAKRGKSVQISRENNVFKATIPYL